MKTVALGVCNIHDSFRNKASIGLYKRKKMHCSEKHKLLWLCLKLLQLMKQELKDNIVSKM